MMDIKKIQSYFPPMLQAKNYTSSVVREYLQFMILDYLSNSRFARNITFIGGTCLRLVHGIDRFSEDLDFDNKGLSREDFIKMTDGIASYLKNSGLNVEFDDKEKDLHLKAFRRNLVFPRFLYDNGLSNFVEEKFLIKIESQDQQVNYQPNNVYIQGCGFIFNFPVPGDDILCAMKLCALIDRRKGRDFYDAMFLLVKSEPNMDFLEKRKGIKNSTELSEKLLEIADTTDLNIKARDFEKLAFIKDHAKRVIGFKDFLYRNFPRLKKGENGEMIL